jgi:hypothetical protein
MHVVLHIDYEVVSQSTATAYLRIRVTRIRVSRGLTVYVFLRCVQAHVRSRTWMSEVFLDSVHCLHGAG